MTCIQLLLGYSCYKKAFNIYNSRSSQMRIYLETIIEVSVIHLYTMSKSHLLKSLL